jgi:hypothetical protein
MVSGSGVGILTGRSTPRMIRLVFGSVPIITAVCVWKSLKEQKRYEETAAFINYDNVLGGSAAGADEV